MNDAEWDDWRFRAAVRSALKDEELTQAGGILPCFLLMFGGALAADAGGWWWLLAVPLLMAFAGLVWVVFIEAPRKCKRAEAAVYVEFGRPLPKRLRKWTPR